jgi:hypothetical protein
MRRFRRIYRQIGSALPFSAFVGTRIQGSKEKRRLLKAAQDGRRGSVSRRGGTQALRSSRRSYPNLIEQKLY